VTLLLELNDAELTLYRGAQVLYAQPGAALLQGGAVVFGRDAREQARLHPQSANQHYLARMNTDPLPFPSSLCANNADLVYQHLLELSTFASEAVVISVPGVFSNDQLGVLLGIAQEAGLEVRGFVDTAVLLASHMDIGPRTYVLDLHLNHACLTELALDDELRCVSAEELTGCGFTSCVDGWVNLIADRFVHQTRFDPLHAANTEQQLYNQVFAWTDSEPEGGEFEVVVTLTDHERRVSVVKAALQEKLAQRLSVVHARLPTDATLLLSPHTACLPGLTSALSDLGISMRTIEPDAIMNNFAHHSARITGDGAPRLTTRLASAGKPVRSTTSVGAATHVLIEGHAYPLEGNRLGLPQQGKIGTKGVHDGLRYELIVVES
jgi:hypothetical protein|tara:strand:- start:874 stop:2013 length:1140 start_codon:yes stop_codon:yes gene_type:complete